MLKIKWFLNILTMSLCLMLFATSVQALPTVNLELSSSDIHVGDTFSIDVLIDGVTDIDPLSGLVDEILAFGFDVDYTASEFDYNDATIDSSFLDDSASFSNTDVAGSAFPGPNGNNILLASLSFTSLIEGSYSLGIISDITDPNEGLTTWLYYYDGFTGTPGQIDITSNINLDVTSAAPVPEPATILLVGTGLAGVGLIRGRKKRS